jgi:hypothetical protein
MKKGVAGAPEGFPLEGTHWIVPVERRAALRAFTLWKARLDRQRPALAEENNRIAINAAYSGAAFVWMALWVPLILAAAFSFSANRTLTIVLSVAAILPTIAFFVRLVQAIRAFSAPYRGPRGRADAPLPPNA